MLSYITMLIDTLTPEALQIRRRLLGAHPPLSERARGGLEVWASCILTHSMNDGVNQRLNQFQEIYFFLFLWLNMTILKYKHTFLLHVVYETKVSLNIDVELS